MKGLRVTSLLCSLLVLLTMFPDPATATSLTLSGNLRFASLDGSSQDADGTVNDVFTVNGDLVLDGTINCNDDLPLTGNQGGCPVGIAVTGNMTMNAGSGIFTENRRETGDSGLISLTVGGDLILHGPAASLPGAVVSSSRIPGSSGQTRDVSADVSGAVTLEAGSIIAASTKTGNAGTIRITAGGAARIAGLIASGASRTVLASRWTGPALDSGSSGQGGGPIILRSRASASPGIRIEPTATVVSQGEEAGGNLVLLEACGIEVRGLVASLSKNNGLTQVVLRSGKGILVDGQDLGNPAAPTARFGRVRGDGTQQGANGYLVDLFAEGDIQVFGPVSTNANLAAVTSSPGEQPQRLAGGTINAISLGGALSATGNAFTTGRDRPGDRGGAIDLRSRGDVTLDDAALRSIGDLQTNASFRAGGTIAVRSYQGNVSWTFGIGDVRPAGTGFGPNNQGRITLTACGTIDITGTQFPVMGNPVAPFPVENEGVCSPAAPSLPAGEPALPVCNRQPAADDQTATTKEDTAVNLTLTGSDPDSSPLTFSIVTPPAHGSLGALTSPTATSVQVTYTPNADFNGSDSFTFQVDDGQGGHDTGTVSLTVTAVNDVPSFTAGPDQTVGEDAGPQTVSPWATAISAGAANESGQVLDFQVTGNSNPGLFAAGPAVSSSGVLTYTPVAGATGTAAITLVLHDNGGTADGGADTSAPQTFNITVLPVNDAPSFVKGPDVSAFDNGGPVTVSPWATAISAGPPDESGQALSFQVTGNSNPGIFAAGPAVSPAGVLTFTPAQVPSGTSTATITIVLHDNGGTANGGVDTSAPQSFVISITHANNPPALVANPRETFDTIGNTLLEVSGAPGADGPKVVVGHNLLANFTDSDGPSPLSASLVAASSGAVVTIDPNSGTFTYLPPAGATGTDTFTYSVTDGESTVTRTVTIHLLSRVWYVKNDAAADDGLGRSSDPFDTLAEAQAASAANDTIFVFAGDGTTAGQDAGIALKNGQRLIGEAVGLSVSVGVNGNAAPTHLVDADGRPLLDATAANTNAVSATDAIPAEIAGLSLAGSTNGIDITTTGIFSGSGTLDIHDIVVRSAGLEGIDINAGGTGTLTLSVRGSDLTAAGTGLDLQRSGGTVIVTAFGDNVVREATGGSGIVVTGPVTFDAIPGGAVNPVSGGTTNIGVPGNGVGGAGLVLTGISGSLGFNALGVFADGGAGVRVTGSGPATAQLGVTGTGIVAATGGPALDLATLTADLQHLTLTSTNSANTGVALNGIAGTVSADSSSSISNIASAAGTAFQVGTSTAAISYAGTISTSTGKGVDLTGNTGGTIAFTGTLTLSTGINPAFNATGGGTVTATDANSTLTTTTGTALNVASTTIGASGLKFKSISAGTAASGPASGIVLNNTGASGGLTVTGTGTAGSGGTIQRAATGISLTSTRSVSISSMQLNDFTDFGIRGSSVVNFTMDKIVINGVNGNDPAADEGSVRFTELTGTASISNSNISGAVEDTFAVINTTGTLNRITFTSTTFGANSTPTGDNGLLLEARSSAVLNATVQNSFFTSSRGDLVQATITSGATGSMDVVFSGNALSDNHPAIVAGGGGALFGGVGGTFTYNISGNTFRDGTGDALVISCGGVGSTCSGRIEGNQMGVAAVANSGSTSSSGIALVSAAGGTFTSLVNNNTVRQYNNHGIRLQAGDMLGNPLSFNVTVTNNTVGNPGTLNTNFNGIQLNSGTVSTDNFTACVDIRGNNIAGSGSGTVAPNNADFRLRQRQSTTVRLPGYGGANNNDAAVVAFVSGNNTVSTGASSNTVPTGGGFVGGAACPQP
jgi:hypothetical protein